MNFNLHKDLASTGWHSSIATTYSVDPAFYDVYVQRRLRQYGVKNNILMADAGMLKMALNALPEAFMAAGFRYAVVPVSVAGAFHPKVHLRLGENRARLVIGSANVTTAGWGKNQEVVTRLDWSWRAEDDEDNAAMGSLVAKVYTYLTKWLEKTPGEVIRYKLQMIERQSQWLRELRPSRSPVTLSDGSAADLLCESGGDSPSMLKQFSELASQEKVRRLIVVSPYWDVDLRGFRDLRAALGKPVTFVALNPRKNAFPVGALRRGDALRFVAIDRAESAKFLHAKIFVAQTNRADHVLFGSANCSDDALGRRGGLSRNAEVSVYRRLSPGQALESLGIDLTKVVPRAEVLAPIRIPTSAAVTKASVPAGVMELRGQSLTWWPACYTSAPGAIIEVGGFSLTPCEGIGGKWVAEFTAIPIFPLIAKVRYRDGRLSDPVIVHSETPLRKAAPGLIDPKLTDALDKARGPDGDLLELASQAHIIFEPAQRVHTAKGATGRSRKRKNKDHAAVSYESEEEFRNAMEMQPGTGKTGRMDEHDPGLQDLLAVITRGIADSRPQSNADDEEDDEALLAGDAEDDADELQDHENEEENNEQQTPQQQKPPLAVGNTITRSFTADQMQLRRKQLVKAFDLFDAMLVDLTENPSLITSRLAVQTMFVFRLMRYGCAHVHNMSDGTSQKLMVMSDGGLEAERPYSFVLRTAWILKRMWTGERPVASRIRLGPRQSELPDDIYGFIVVSRWALARAYLESKKSDERVLGGKARKLTATLNRIGKEIYAATASMGRVDPNEERQTIAEMDSDIGCTSTQNEELMGCLREFGAAANQMPAPR